MGARLRRRRHIVAAVPAPGARGAPVEARSPPADPYDLSRAASSMAEHRAFNPLVQGSTPWRPTKRGRSIQEPPAPRATLIHRGPVGSGWMVAASAPLTDTRRRWPAGT